MNIERRQYIPDPIEKIDKVKIESRLDLEEKLQDLRKEQSTNAEIQELVQRVNELLKIKVMSANFIAPPEKSVTSGMDKSSNEWLEYKSKLLEFKRTLEPAMQKEWSRILYKVIESIKGKYADIGSLKIFEILDGVLKLPTNVVIADNYDSEIDGSYSAFDNKAIYAGKYNILDYRLLLLEISRDGYSKAASVIHHELIHQYQNTLPTFPAIIKNDIKTLIEVLQVGGKVLLYKLLRSGDETLIKEIHAYVGQSLRSENTPVGQDLINHLENLYDLIPDKDSLSRATSLMNDMNKLYALGLTDQGIADLLNGAVWNKRTKSYSAISDTVKKLMEISRISNSELEELVSQIEIRRSIYLEQIKIISRSILQRELSN